MNSFIFFFMIHEATQYRQYRRYRQHKGNQWTNKDEEEIILTNYIVSSLHSGEKKSVCLCRVVFCKACSFEVFCPKKMSQKRENTWIKWYLWSRSYQFFIQKFMYYIMLTLHDPKSPLNVVSTNSFSWASNFISAATWCKNDLRRLQLAQINNSDIKLICQEEINKVIFVWV